MPATTERNRQELTPDDPALTIDPEDPLVPVRDLAKEANGKHPSCVTMWRWCAGKGASGRLRLPAVKLAGKWLTTRRAWLAWLQARTARMEAKRRKDTDSDKDADTDDGMDEEL